MTFLDMPHSAKAVLVAMTILMTDRPANSGGAPQSMAPRCNPDERSPPGCAAVKRGAHNRSPEFGGISGQVGRHGRAVSDDRNRHLPIQRGEARVDRIDDLARERSEVRIGRD